LPFYRSVFFDYRIEGGIPPLVEFVVPKVQREATGSCRLWNKERRTRL